jgi:hypothetical protein
MLVTTPSGFYLLSADDETAWYLRAREFAIMGCLIDVLTPLHCHVLRSGCIAVSGCPALEAQDDGILEYEIGRTSTA